MCMLRYLFSPSFSALQRAGRGWNGTRRASCNALVYEAFGQPENVVKLVYHVILSDNYGKYTKFRLDETYPVNDLGSEDIAVEMVACPVNPSDINMIQGTLICAPALISLNEDACFIQVSTQLNLLCLQ